MSPLASGSLNSGAQSYHQPPPILEFDPKDPSELLNPPVSLLNVSTCWVDWAV